MLLLSLCFLREDDEQFGFRKEGKSKFGELDKIDVQGEEENLEEKKKKKMNWNGFCFRDIIKR